MKFYISLLIEIIFKNNREREKNFFVARLRAGRSRKWGRGGGGGGGIGKRNML